MTTLISVVGIVGRVAGRVLTAALGWASSLLFGRVPRSHQIYLALLLAGSLLWSLLVLALLVQPLAAFILALTGVRTYVPMTWLRMATIVTVAFLPLAIGLAGYLVPARGERASGTAAARQILSGYPLALILSFLLLFLPVVALVRKLHSLRRRWADAHIPIVVKPGGYEQMVVDLRSALDGVGLGTTAGPAPAILAMPGRLLAAVAVGNVRAYVPERLIELSGADLEIGLYPFDIAISGGDRARTRARTAILGGLATTSAYMTPSAESQVLEDRLRKLGTVLQRVPPWAPDAAAEFVALDAALINLDVPAEEWGTLQRSRLQVERDAFVAARRRGETAGGDGAMDGIRAGAREDGHRMLRTTSPVPSDEQRLEGVPGRRGAYR